MTPDPWIFAFRGGELLLREGVDGASALPAGDPLDLGLDDALGHPVGDVHARPAVALRLADDAPPPAGLELVPLRRAFGRLPEPLFAAAGRAFQLLEWRRTQRFCGACGAPTRLTEHNGALRCENCGHLHFPRISPAIIVLVRHGDLMLLARSPGFAPGVYSPVAGFVEPGEALEEAVAREVKEEVGLDVAHVRYFGSQPWPFPHSLMVAFTADYAGGELCLQPEEIEDARWFSPDDLPVLSSPLSIARRLVDAFLAEMRPARTPGRHPAAGSATPPPAPRSAAAPVPPPSAR